MLFLKKDQITRMDDVHTVRISRMSTWYLVPLAVTPAMKTETC